MAKTHILCENKKQKQKNVKFRRFWVKKKKKRSPPAWSRSFMKIYIYTKTVAIRPLLSHAPLLQQLLTSPLRHIPLAPAPWVYFSVRQMLLDLSRHWKPVLGTKLLGFSVGRGLGALKGLTPFNKFRFLSSSQEVFDV